MMFGRLKSILVSVFALFALGGLVSGIVSDVFKAPISQDLPIRIHLKDPFWANKEAKEKSPMILMQELLLEHSPTSVEEFEAAKGDILTRGLQSNLMVFQHLANKRTRWLGYLKHVLRFLCLGFLVLLFAPFWIRKRLKGHPDGVKRAWDSVPFFFVATLLTVWLTSELAGQVVSLQVFEVALATTGSPQVALINDFSAYLYFFGDERAMSFLQTLSGGVDLAQMPIGFALSSVENIQMAVAQSEGSALLSFASTLGLGATYLVDLYGPLLALVSLFLFYAIMRPLVREIIRYPIDVAEGREEPNAWRFTKDSMRLFWREFRAFLWTQLFIVFVLLMGVLVVHLLCFPIAISGVDSVLSTLMEAQQGNSFPEWAVFCSLLAGMVYLIGGFISLMVPLGLALKQNYIVARHKVMHRNRFRDYPNLRALYRFVFVRSTLRTALSAGLAAIVYGVGFWIWPESAIRVWWSALCFGPIFVGALWWLKPLAGFRALYKADPLLLNSAADGGGSEG